MTIHLTDKTQSLIYTELPGNVGNFLAAIDIDGDQVVLIYRFRYYKKDDKIVGSKDERRWYRYVGPAGTLESMRALLMDIIGQISSEIWQVHREGQTTEDMVRQLQAAPFAHGERHTVQ